VREKTKKTTTLSYEDSEEIDDKGSEPDSGDEPTEV
jgi:hypothetical protein